MFNARKNVTFIAGPALCGRPENDIILVMETMFNDIAVSATTNRA
jgi:hypothetical protein